MYVTWSKVVWTDGQTHVNTNLLRDSTVAVVAPGTAAAAVVLVVVEVKVAVTVVAVISSSNTFKSPFGQMETTLQTKKKWCITVPTPLLPSIKPNIWMVRRGGKQLMVTARANRFSSSPVDGLMHSLCRVSLL